MADDAAPSEDNIHGVAKEAGVEMKKALEQDPKFAQSSSNLAWSYIEPYQKVLGPVMKHFEDQVRRVKQ
jgi:hypothetical protein